MRDHTTFRNVMGMCEKEFVPGCVLHYMTVDHAPCRVRAQTSPTLFWLISSIMSNALGVLSKDSARNSMVRIKV